MYASRAKQLQGLDPTGCVSSVLREVPDLVFPKALRVSSLQVGCIQLVAKSSCLI